jgi:hypothetical protein
MLKTYIASLNDQMHQLDNFLTLIRKRIFEMIKTIIKYVKLFLKIAFKSSKYFFAVFGIIFTLIFLFSKEKKGNLYVLLYFFIGYMMFNMLLGIFNLFIYVCTKIYSIIANAITLTHPGRTTRYKAKKSITIAIDAIIILAVIILMMILFFMLSFIYSVEIYLYDVINEIFRVRN